MAISFLVISASDNSLHMGALAQNVDLDGEDKSIVEIECLEPAFFYACSSGYEYHPIDTQTNVINLKAKIDDENQNFVLQQSQQHRFVVKCKDTCGGTYLSQIELHASHQKRRGTSDAQFNIHLKVIDTNSKLRADEDTERQFEYNKAFSSWRNCAQGETHSLQEFLDEIKVIAKKLPPANEVIELNSKLEKISFLSIDDPNYLANVTTLADGLQVALRDGYDTQEHLAVTLKHLAGAPGRSNTSESRKTPSTYHKGGCLYNHAEGASICFGRECKNGIKIGNFEKNIEDFVYNYRDLQMRGVDPGLPTEGRFNFSPEHYSIFSSHAGPLQDSYKEKVCPQVREVQKFKPIQRKQETQASLNSTHEGDATGKPTISALIPTNHAGIPFAITVSQIESAPHKYYFSKIEVLAQGKTEGEISEAIFEMLKKEAGQFDIEPIYSSQNSTAQGNQPCFLTSTGQPIPIYIHTGSKKKLAYFSNCIPYGGTKISFR